MSVNVVDNDVTVTASQKVEVANEVVTNTIVNEYPNTINVKSNEFAVVGDGLFATTKEEVPGWMRELVGDLATSATANVYNAMAGFNYNLYNAMLALQVAENKYQQAINTRITDQEAFVQAVETLNSTVQNAEAEIVGIKQTYATKDFAMATVAQTLEASLNGGAIKSSLGQLATTMSNQYGTMAQRMDVLESTFEDLELGVEGYASATHTLETYVGLAGGGPDGTGLLARVQVLEKQTDGVIETITGTYDVIKRADDPNLSELVTTAEPYASWLAAEVNGGIEVRLSHIGDVYIKYINTDKGAKEYLGSFKFIRTTVDISDDYKSTDSAGFTWAAIQDQAAEMAYTAALKAYDLADGKRRVFVGLGNKSTPTVPYDIGDLWLLDVDRSIGTKQYSSGDILRAIESKGAGATYESNDWVLASSFVTALKDEIAKVEAWKTNTYGSFVKEIQKQVDNKAESFYQEAMPRPEGTDVNYALWVGDLWKKPSDNTSYIYSKVKNSYKWVLSDVPDSIYDAIDGKKAIYSGNNIPSGNIQENDTWFTGDTPPSGYEANAIYIYVNGSWTKGTKYTDDTAVTILENGLENGKIKVNLESAVVGDVAFNTYLASQIDKKLNVYSGITGPSVGLPVGVEVDDIYLWFTTVDKKLADGSTKTYDITKTYKYISKDNKFIWSEITTNDDISALADLADGKRSIFSGSTKPTGAVERDLWIPSANNGKYLKGEVYQYIKSEWVAATRYTEDLGAYVETFNNNVLDLQSQIDGQINYYFYNSSLKQAGSTTLYQTPKSASGSASWTSDALKKEHHGDIAYDRDAQVGYYYSRFTGAWTRIDGSANLGIITALKNAAAAQASADNVVVSYFAIERDTSPDSSKLWKDNSNKLKKYDTGSYSWKEVVAKRGDTLTTQVFTKGKTGDYEYTDTKHYVYNGTTWVTETGVGIVASSKSITDLKFDLGELNNKIYGESGLEQTLRGEIIDGVATAESKFAYNSKLTINDVEYYTGFGLSNSAGTGIGSEFWINADKLKFTNDSKTGKVAPFTIDAKGTTPQITFNGKVSFSNVTNVPAPTSVNMIPDSTPSLGTKLVKLGWYNTNTTPVYGQNNTDWTCNGINMPYVTVSGTPTVNSVFDLRIVPSQSTDFFTVKAGNKYSVSAHISAHRCTGKIAIAWYDSDKAYISELHGTEVTTMGNLTTDRIAKSSLVATAPANAAYAYVYARGFNNGGTNPYIFAVNWMFTVTYTDSEVPYTSNTTTIDGSKITTGSITADRIATGTITTDLLSLKGNNNIYINKYGIFITDGTALRIAIGDLTKTQADLVNWDLGIT